jgi:RNA polymerase sigma-70 factor, ECF subfamily
MHAIALRNAAAMRRELYSSVTLDDVMPAPKSRNVKSAEMRESLLSLIPNVRAFAVSLCGDPEHADDLVQETLLKAWTHFERFEPGTNLRAWLFTILRNHYFSECRVRRHRGEDPDGHKLEALCVPAGQDGYVDMQDFRKALNLLPVEQREALILVAAAGFSYEEAATIGSCAVGTIKSRVNRARAKLAQLLGVQRAHEFGPDAATEAIVTHSTGRIGAHGNTVW